MDERGLKLGSSLKWRFGGWVERAKRQLKEHSIGYAIGSLGWVFFAVLLWNDYVVFGPGFLRHVFTRAEFPRHLLAFFLIPLTMGMGYLYESLPREPVQEGGKKTPEKEPTKHLEEVLDTLTEQISVIDRDFRILSFNRAFAEATGYPEDQIKGERCYRVIHGYDDKEFETLCKDRCLVKKAFGEGRLIEDVHRHEEDGKERYHEIKALPSKDIDGSVRQVVYVVEDVTKKRGMEGELIKYSEKLEQSNKLKELLLDILSHDLINPLTVVKTASEFLSREEGLKGKEEVEIIAESANRLERIIKDAMTCARLESYEALNFEEDDLVHIIKDVVYEYRDAAEERGVEVVFEGEGGECRAEVTPFMSDVFSNLLSNALKFSPPDSKVVINVEGRNGRWRVSMKDYGEGVPDEYKKAIFERFKRVSKFGGAKGTGLGLAIVERIVKLHGGAAWVEDNPEGGSIFFVEIPKKRGKS